MAAILDLVAILRNGEQNANLDFLAMNFLSETPKGPDFKVY